MFGVLHASNSSNDKIEFLYKKYYKLLYKIVSKNVQNIDDIEDCIQESFSYFLKNIEKTKKSSNKEVKNYLATIANGFSLNKLKQNIKDENTYRPDDENTQGYEIVDFSNSSFDSISALELSLVIDKLGERDKNFFYLTYIYGYTSKEIADMFNIKDSYVRKRLQLSKEFLRKELTTDE